MKAQWHSRNSVTISYTKGSETRLMAWIGTLVSAISLLIISNAFVRIFAAVIKHEGLKREVVYPIAASMAVSPRTTWWSTSNWLSAIPQPRMLIVTDIADGVVDIWFAIFITILCWLLKSLKNNRITQEQLTITQGLGVQVRWLSGKHVRFVKFIPIERFEEAVVTEGFQNSRVVSMLALMVKGQVDLIIPFRHTLPYEEDLWVIQDAISKLL